MEEPRAGAGDAGARRLAVRTRLAAHAPALAAAVAGVAWLAWHADLAIAVPRNVGWLMRGDWGAGYVAWLFYRSAPPALPLGSNPLYPYPIGSTLGFSDALPLVAVLLRPLASVLPQDFQYAGAWIVLAFALQGFVGAKLVKLATPDRLAQALGGVLFVLAPPLLHRLIGPKTGHASLCAQWILLLALWLALAPVDAPRLPRRLALAGLLVFLSAGVHPYFVVMTAALAAALILRIVLVERRGGPALLGGGLTGLAAAASAGLLLFGFVGGGVRSRANGFGYFSADLATLVNPMGWSRLWSGLPVRAGQYEGFAYLGAGALLLLVLGLGAIALRRAPAPRLARVVPAVAVALVLAGFALSDAVRFAGDLVLRVGIYRHMPWLGGTFRSSGRFVWPLHYLLLLGGVSLAARVLHGRALALRGALALAVVAQAFDVRPPVPLEPPAAPYVPAAEWALARGSYRHLSMFPPYLVAGGDPIAPEPQLCGPHLHRPDGYLPLALVAYRIGATFDGAYTARLDPARAIEACQAARRAIDDHALDPATIYVVHPSAVALLVAAGADCGWIGADRVCVARGRPDAFSEAVRARPLRADDTPGGR
ncbi:MAG TPA: DUF6311 domain-containing protein [Anaeromyxobacter sp.]|nr:DUF6311 domain-containing protein [Anaeromyxobacter sp.]